MKKTPIEVTINELEEILDRYLDTEEKINYAIKIIGHPGVGKSALVKEVAQRKNFHYIDTRLAFKENIDLGGYPVPDHECKRMIYYRPRFIPPETIPEGCNGVIWFLDESNRAHPTVIQTLFQIITENTCGEHDLPDGTKIILAGNLGENDSTTITEFDDSALDGRLAIFHLKPSVPDWLKWANENNIHHSIMKYISLFPNKLWDEININPNPRGWHQASLAISESYGLSDENELLSHLNNSPDTTLIKLINSLTGNIAGTDFISQITAPREISTDNIIKGDTDSLKKIENNEISTEDMLWAMSGAIDHLKEKNINTNGRLDQDGLIELSNFIRFTGILRSDSRISFFYLLLKECGLFSKIPEAIKIIKDKNERKDLIAKFSRILNN